MRALPKSELRKCNGLLFLRCWYLPSRELFRRCADLPNQFRGSCFGVDSEQRLGSRRPEEHPGFGAAVRLGCIQKKLDPVKVSLAQNGVGSQLPGPIRTRPLNCALLYILGYVQVA